MPLSSFTAQKLNLHPRTVADLLICINSPRWHLLSWVMDWPSLEQKCKELLENPDIRKQDSELKYLVIDYTQFDDWSSEEDMLEHQNYGIGKELTFDYERLNCLFLTLYLTSFVTLKFYL